MHGEKPDLLVAGKLQYARPQERSPSQVERAPGLFNDQPLNFVLALGLGQLSSDSMIGNVIVSLDAIT